MTALVDRALDHEGVLGEVHVLGSEASASPARALKRLGPEVRGDAGPFFFRPMPNVGFARRMPSSTAVTEQA
jgi:hypothetical protein